MHRPSAGRMAFASVVGLLAAAFPKGEVVTSPRQIGPGVRRSSGKVARSKYVPHNGKRECARRRGEFKQARALALAA